MSYYRQARVSFGPPLTPMVKLIILVTSAVFLVTYLPLRITGWSLPYVLFSLRTADVTHFPFAIWQLFTYLFLHAGFFHIIFNLFALWMFGSELEQRWGPQRFLYFYLLTGVGAGLCDVVIHALFQPSSASATIGCSGAVYGVLMAYGMLFPDRPILLWMIIPIRAKWFVALMGLIEFVTSFDTPGDGVSHMAHLGGMLFAYLYLRNRGGNFNLKGRVEGWRRARLRRKFEVYMRDQEEKKHDAGRWVN